MTILFQIAAAFIILYIVEAIIAAFGYYITTEVCKAEITK